MKIVFILLIVAFLSGCAGLMSGITGQPILTTSVQRAGQPDAPVIMIASGDLAQAEAQAKLAESNGTQKTAYGLYDAGRVASLVEQTVDASGK